MRKAGEGGAGCLGQEEGTGSRVGSTATNGAWLASVWSGIPWLCYRGEEVFRTQGHSRPCLQTPCKMSRGCSPDL